jgi:Zn-finger nucleic acid-binding protein
VADPYRTPAARGCPLCGEQLDLSQVGAIACGNGCGEWLPRAHLATILDLADLDLKPYSSGYHRERVDYRAPPCPQCARELALSWIETVPIRVCAEHGMWVAAAVRDRFTQQLAAPIARHERLVAVMELLASAEPAARRELARRILALEDQVASLTVLCATIGKTEL